MQATHCPSTWHSKTKTTRRHVSFINNVGLGWLLCHTVIQQPGDDSVWSGLEWGLWPKRLAGTAAFALGIHSIFGVCDQLQLDYDRPWRSTTEQFLRTLKWTENMLFSIIKISYWCVTVVVHLEYRVFPWQLIRNDVLMRWCEQYDTLLNNCSEENTLWQESTVNIYD